MLKRKFQVFYSLAVLGGLLFLYSTFKTDDSYVINKVVKLVSDKGLCSGEQVRAPSGADYILTAGHCDALAKNGYITVITEDGKMLNRRVIEEDKESDLLLLEGLPGVEGLAVAEDLPRYSEISTFTHGHGMDTYKTSGVIITEQSLMVPLSLITSPEEADKCAKGGPKQQLFSYEMNVYCVLDVLETVTTALIVPGSSGGAVVNSDKQLVGVASASGDGFGYLVRLQDIKNFLSNY